MRRFFSFLLLLAVLIACSSLSSAQTQGHPIPQAEQRNEEEAKLQREQAKKLNKERQEALKRDTDKLLKLSTELKEYVDKSDEHVLSLDVIRKAEQIEKLAHSVREKMKGY